MAEPPPTASADDHVADLVSRARAWIAGDPDPVTRRELEDLVAASDAAALADRVGGSLAFGTAGLRAAVGAGSLRMNRAVVIRTTRGLADHLAATIDDPVRPVVVGGDARPDSPRFVRDVVGVLAAAGRPVLWFADPVPTPLVAYAARASAAAAAVVVTASHNPPEDNGYKVYGADAIQIVPPQDAAIAAAIAAVGPAAQVPRIDELDGHDLVAEVGPDLADRYLAELAAARPAPPPSRDLVIVHTPLHGVGGALALRALAAAGYADLHPVPAQAQPDGRFPTVRFPNPEEPGALDLAFAVAAEVGADLVLANDPDADRLAAAIPHRDGGWRALSGDEIGVLLGARLLESGPDDDRLTVASIVSSPMLGEVAADHGARHEVTLTGFKWICTAAQALADDGYRLVLGYEEALGYTVGTVVRDKDGIGAAVVFADLVAGLAASGRTVEDRLVELARHYGLWVHEQVAVTVAGPDGPARIADAVGAAAASPPSALEGVAIEGVDDLRVGEEERPPWLPAAPLVGWRLAGGGRVLVRPSGTEPKAKLYVDLRTEVTAGDDVLADRRRLAGTAAAIGTAAARHLGLA